MKFGKYTISPVAFALLLVAGVIVLKSYQTQLQSLSICAMQLAPLVIICGETSTSTSTSSSIPEFPNIAFLIPILLILLFTILTLTKRYRTKKHD